MKSSLPPGPRGPWPAQLFRYVYGTTAFLDACAARFGDVFTLRLGDAGTLVVVHAPEHVREVFTGDAAVLQAGRSNAIARPIVGERSVFVLDGAPHLHLRRLLLPPFHGDRMRSYAGIVEDAVHRRVDRWRPGQRFAIHRDMQDVTLDVILRAVFGLTDDVELERLRGALARLFAPMPAIFSFLPSLQIDRPGSPFRLWLRRRAKVMAMLDALVAERRRQPDLAAREDILSLLLLARDDHGRGLSDAELRDQLVTLLVAGHETTATALAWAFERVLCHPEVEARLRAELASSGGPGKLDPARVEKLPFLDAVLKEVSRQRPVLPLVARGLAAPCAIAGYELPAGVIVAPCLYLTHRRPELYPEPDAFRPDRWLEGRSDPHHYYPFGGGLRRCIGMSFALYEMKLVLAAVLSRCRLSMARPGPLRVTRRTITLWPAGGTPVVVDGVAAR